MTVNSKTSGGGSVIGSGVRIKGQIVSDDDLHIDGEIEGTVHVPKHQLTVGPHGRVQADITARDVVINGAANGKFTVAEKLELVADSKVSGEVKAQRLAIADGAYFSGRVDLGEPRQAAAKTS